MVLFPFNPEVLACWLRLGRSKSKKVEKVQLEAGEVEVFKGVEVGRV